MADYAFSQQYCSVVPYQAGGALVAGRKRQSCLVRVRDGELIIIEAPADLVDVAPVTTIEIDTPALQRKLGTAVFVKMNSNRWAIDFGLVGQREAYRRGGPRRFLAIFGIGSPKAIGRSRQLTRDFVAVLLSEGATDPRAKGSRPSLA